MRSIQGTPVNENFEKLVSQHLKSLETYCHYIAYTKWDAEDLMQETLEKLYRYSRTKQVPVSKAYLHKIASNTWTDRLRKKKIEEVLTEHKDEISDDANSTTGIADEAIKQLLESCTPKQRTVFLLVEALDLSLKEAAGVLTMSEGSIKSCLHRARKRVQADFIREYEIDEETVSVYRTILVNGDLNKLIQLFRDQPADNKQRQNPKMAFIPTSSCHRMAA
ncbi:RNA polymerase sigma factor [Alkalihalobacillus sp. NPDC078783]